MPEDKKAFKSVTGYKRPTLSKSDMATVKKEVDKAKPVVAKKPVAKKSSSFADRAAAVEKSNKAKGVTNIATKAPSTGAPSSVRDMQRIGKTMKELNIKPKEGMGVIEYIAPTGVGSSATSILKNPTLDNVVNAVINTGINAGIDVADDGLIPKGSKYVLKGTKYGAKARPLLTKAAVLGNDFFNKINK